MEKGDYAFYQISRNIWWVPAFLPFPFPQISVSNLGKCVPRLEEVSGVIVLRGINCGVLPAPPPDFPERAMPPPGLPGSNVKLLMLSGSPNQSALFALAAAATSS